MLEVLEATPAEISLYDYVRMAKLEESIARRKEQIHRLNMEIAAFSNLRSAMRTLERVKFGRPSVDNNGHVPTEIPGLPLSSFVSPDLLAEVVEQPQPAGPTRLPADHGIVLEGPRRMRKSRGTIHKYVPPDDGQPGTLTMPADNMESQDRLRIMDYLEAHGPATVLLISADTGLHSARINRLLLHPRFSETETESGIWQLRKI